MNDIFAAIYEKFFYDGAYNLIFQVLYDNGGYIKFGLLFIFIPLFFNLLFYFVWRYPYGKFWHWLIWFVVSVITVIGLTWSCANTEILGSTDPNLISALADQATGYETYARSLPMKYAFLNGGLSMLAGFIYSLIIKQFSKIQIHLPF
jgi:hypothetical protein